jgi:predicted nucleotidyltransferase
MRTGGRRPRKSGLQRSKSSGGSPTATVFPRHFSEFLRLLEDEKVEYLLIGGFAVGYYGYPRPTADMDVWVAVNPTNAGRIVQALQRFGMTSPDLKEDLFLSKGPIIRIGVPPLRLEVQTDIAGVAFEECFRRRRRVVIDDVEVNLIDLADLRANKRAAGRHKDLDDLEHLPEP